MFLDFQTVPEDTVLVGPTGGPGPPSFRLLTTDDIRGLGTAATANLNAIAITGGTINGTPIGATTADTGRFTTLTLTTSQSAKFVFAAPNGANGAPTFRQLLTSDISGLGSIATQAANLVAITGGAIDGTPIGATTPSTGAFSGLSLDGAAINAATLLRMAIRGTGSAQQSGFSIVTASASVIDDLGSATSKGWQITARSNTWPGEANDLRYNYWNGTGWIFPITVVSTSGAVILGRSLIAGSPTGGDMGIGTINATGIFVNGVAVGSGVGTDSPTFRYSLTLDGVGGSPNLKITSRGIGDNDNSITLVTKSADVNDGLGSATAKGWIFVARSDGNTYTQANYLIWSFWNGTSWNEYFRLLPTGPLELNSLYLQGVTGGSMGAGTINAAGIYINGVAVSTNSGDMLKSENLSGLANYATARTNLGLGTIATQAANSVALTGGTINGASVGATTASTGRFTTLTATGTLNLATGTATVGPLKFTSGTLLTTAVAGTMEFNGTTLYFTTAASTRRQIAMLDNVLLQKSVTIVSPTATEKVVMYFTKVARTVAEIRGVVQGTSPSVAFNIHYGADIAAAGTAVMSASLTATSTTTGNVSTTFANATIPANSWVWLTTTAKSGTVDAFHATVEFTA